jgi:hypothetical protein
MQIISVVFSVKKTKNLSFLNSEYNQNIYRYKVKSEQIIQISFLIDKFSHLHLIA